MQGSTTPYVVSADPGSSAKGWAVASCDADPGGQVVLRKMLSPQLRGLVQELCEQAEQRPVLLGLDAPIRAFGGVQAPADLDPQGDKAKILTWPFDVNPFSQRPCEHALRAAPPMAPKYPAQRALAEAIRELIAGPKRVRKGTPNRSFIQAHPGVSVLGYMGAPHAPVVRTFLNALTQRATETGVATSYEVDGAQPESRTIYILESHPAVAMGFYASYASEGFGPAIAKYKGAGRSSDCFVRLCAATHGLLCVNREMPLETKIATDDDLDAFVGLLHLLDLAENRGDLFGTAHDGYFLVPCRPQGDSFRDLWARASAESAGRISKPAV